MNLRLRDPAYSEPDETSEDQHPDKVGRQGAQQPKVKREQRTHDQFLQTKPQYVSSTSFMTNEF